MGAVDSPPLGLYGPDTVTWRVNRELALLIGGGSALLLQVAHPLVGAGVQQHSSFEADPWGRLARTLDLTTKIVFGDPETSARAARRLRGRHRTVGGVSDGGVPYHATDPDLLLWVWATLVDTGAGVYARFVGPLTEAERERYYVEQQRFAVACGVPEGHWPATLPAFRAYVAAVVGDELQATAATEAVWRSVVRPPGLPGPLHWAARPAAEATIGLLPDVLRARLGLDWGPRRERALATSAFGVRRALPLLPAAAREFPEARAAARRFAARPS